MMENEARQNDTIIQVKDLKVNIKTDDGILTAVRGVNFEIKKGEAVAFLGENGAGKSTALKLVTGVAYPTSGTVTVNGHVSALLELKAGFDPSLTGRENIHLRGQALGFTEEQICAIEPRAVEFADLGVYIDQPVRMYSSGMKSRLGFGFAVSSDPEILVVDEGQIVQRQERLDAIARETEELEGQIAQKQAQADELGVGGGLELTQGQPDAPEEGPHKADGEGNDHRAQEQRAPHPSGTADRAAVGDPLLFQVDQLLFHL